MNQPYGSTRNLTAQFVKYRNEARRSRGLAAAGPDDKATTSLLSAALGPSSSDVELGPRSSGVQPAWVQKAERVRVEMTLVKDRLVKLREYHNKALLVNFDTDDEISAHTEAVTREIQQSFKRLDGEIRGLDKGPGANSDPEVCKQVQQQLAQALFKLSMEFRKEEIRFLNRVEAQKGLEQGSTLGLIEDEANKSVQDIDPGFTAAQLAIVDNSSALIAQRDEEIQKIVQTISELAQIMRDLSQLVVEQGTVLDRIDFNITQTAVKVEEGVVQLKKAEETQKKGRMFLCIIGLIVMIVIMLIIVIIRHA